MAPSAVDDAVYFQEQRAAGIRVGEPQPEYAVKPEALPNITPEERAAILADIHREWEEMEEDDLEGDFALADEIFRAHGYTDIVGSIREGREERP